MDSIAKLENLSNIIKTKSNTHLNKLKEENKQLKFIQENQQRKYSNILNLLSTDVQKLKKDNELLEEGIERVNDNMVERDNRYLVLCQSVIEYEDKIFNINRELKNLKISVEQLERDVEKYSMPTFNSLYIELMKGFNIYVDKNIFYILGDKIEQYEADEKNENIIANAIWNSIK